MKKFIGCAAVLSMLSVGLSHAQYSREVNRTVALEKDGNVVIDTYKGSVKVATWDRPSVEVAARIVAVDDWWDDGRDGVRLTEIRIEESDNRVLIKTDYDRAQRKRRDFWSIFDCSSINLPEVHYTIMMPSTAELRIKDYKSESTVSDLDAPLHVKTYKGRVELVRVRGAVELETYKGTARVELSELVSSCWFETYKGDITITLPKGTGFDLNASIGSRGRLRTDFDLRHDERSAPSRKRAKQEYRVSVNGGGPTLKLETYKGSYRLREKVEAGFEFVHLNPCVFSVDCVR